MFCLIPSLFLLPDIAIPTSDGFIMPTEYRTLARFQLALNDHEEYKILNRLAKQTAKMHPPNSIHVLHVIVTKINAPAKDAQGNDIQAISEMSTQEIERCRQYFEDYRELVFTYTGGALRIQKTELLISAPVTELNEMGNNRYWLSAWSALKGYEDRIPERKYDCIAVYYKKPDNVQAGLLGGAIGRDAGVRGSPFFTQWITDWKDTNHPFTAPGIVSLHEWLHTVSWTAHRVLGYTFVPDCHAGEEYGYWDQDGGYRQWQAWNRDLMLRYIPRDFWRKYNAQGEMRQPDAPAVNASVKPGAFFSWGAVKDDWMARLPTLSDADLRRITGIPDLTVEVAQPSPNAHVIWRLHTSTKLPSKMYSADLPQAPIQLDNVLVVGRREKPSRQNDPYGGYASAPLESMALLRLPNEKLKQKDLVLIRMDVVDAVLPLLKVRGRPASECLLGFINRQDPSEKQQLNILVVLIDLGEAIPVDELAVLGK
ncbi:MAG: hypothetical protein QXI19_10845 [Candidatus Caldarchaeum sp.]